MSGHGDTTTMPAAGQIRGYHGLRLLRQKLRSRLVVALDCTKERRSTRELAQRLVAGGAGMIRLGCSRLTTRQLVDETAQIVWGCRGMGAPCLVAGRVDVALAVLADGVHLGPADMPAALARRMMGPAAIIGVTCRSVADALEAQREGASYLALDNVLSEEGAAAGEGLALIASIAEQAGLPVCIGGNMSLENVALLGDTPAYLIAVEAAIMTAADAPVMMRALLTALDGSAAAEAEARRPGGLYAPQPSL